MNINTIHNPSMPAPVVLDRKFSIENAPEFLQTENTDKDLFKFLQTENVNEKAPVLLDSNNNVNFKTDSPYESSEFIARPTPPMVSQWRNGVYSYNANFIKNLPVADNITYKLIKNFFTAKALSNNSDGKRTRLIIRRLQRLSLNNILVSKPEIKHFSDKININVFLYNKKNSFLSKKLKEKSNDLDYSIDGSFNSELVSGKTNLRYPLNKPDLTISKSSGRKILYRGIRFKKYRKQNFIYLKHKWNIYRSSVWESEQQLLKLRLKRENYFKQIALNTYYNMPINLIKATNKNVRIEKALGLNFSNNEKYNLNNKPNTKQVMINVVKLIKFITYKLGKARKLNLKNSRLNFTKFNLNLIVLLLYMSKKGYKLNQMLEKINLCINSYLTIWNYVNKKNQIVKSINSKKNKFNRLDKISNRKYNTKKIALNRNVLTKSVKNTVQSITSRKIVKTFKKQSAIYNDITANYTSNILSLLSNILNKACINLLDTRLKTKINLKTKGLNKSLKIIHRVKNENIINTPLNKIQLVGLSSKLTFLKSKTYTSYMLISIFVKGRKLSNLEKNYINKLLRSTNKLNISKIANKYYLYKNNLDFFKKLIVNKYLGYKTEYKVALVNKYKGIISNYTPNKNKTQNSNLNTAYLNKRVGFKRILVKKYKLMNKSLNIRKNNKLVSFNQLKIINKNIIIQKKVNKINKFITKYINLSLKNKSVLFNKNNIQQLKTKNFINYMKDKYIFNYLKDILAKEIIYINYIKMLSFNNTLYKSWFLMPLKSIISKLYNKQVVFNFINLKYLYFSSDLLTQAIVLKLKNIRKNSLHRVLKKVLNLVLVTKLNIYAQSTFNPTYKYTHQHYNKYKYINNIIFKPNNNTGQILLDKSNKNIVNNDIKIQSLDYLNNNNFSPISLKWLDHIQTSTINFIKYKSVFGLKLEAAGRLTKRSTASRAVFKFKFKGNLKNSYTMTRVINPRIKGLNLISNIQYSNLNSKTRNGSFGIKTWINNN